MRINRHIARRTPRQDYCWFFSRGAKVYTAGFTGRENFAAYLNERGMISKHQAAEIGTHRGAFAAAFLATWFGGMLHCIDPWLGGYDSGDPASYGDREADYKECMERLKPHAGRYQIHRTMSVAAASGFEDGSLTLVYVDGNHQPAAVWEDLVLYWPKVESGGLLAGHDVVCPGEADGGWGRHVQPMVERFGRIHNLPVYLVPETNRSPWSFFFIKP